MKIDRANLRQLLTKVMAAHARDAEAREAAKATGPLPDMSDIDKRLEHDIAYAMWGRAGAELRIAIRAYEAALKEMSDINTTTP